MLTNYFKIAFRNLYGNKILSLIKILGLSLGLTVCMLIVLFTKDEMSYDQFHENKHQLFRVTQAIQVGADPQRTIGMTNGILGETFAQQIPEVKQRVRINSKTVIVKKNNEVFTENPLFVDDNFFTIFSFSLLEGNKKTALQDLHAVVLSKEMAKKYFGTADAIGETIQLKVHEKFEDFIVTGIAENSLQNSTLKTDILLPFQYFENQNPNQAWMGGSLNTFLLLSAQADVKRVESKMQALFDANTSVQRAKAKEQGIVVKSRLELQPFLDIHLNKELGTGNGLVEGSNPTYAYILSWIAFFILVIACINFVNLSVAQSLKRGKEVGVRKVVGSSRKQLIKQFFTESFLTTLIAFSLAIGLTVLSLPFFNELANKKLSFAYLSDAHLYVGYFLLLLVTAFLAGFYPSMRLSVFQPIKVLYNRQKVMGKSYFTKSLMVLQFALAIFLIIGTIAMNRQLNFLLHSDLGYNSENLVRIDLPSSPMGDKLPVLFKNELKNQANVLSMAARNGGRTISGLKANGQNIEIEYNKIDDQFLPTFKIPLIAGRNFSPDYPSDSTQSIMVNERFVKKAGWMPDEAIGKSLGSIEGSSNPLTIIGVIKDYHFSSLKEEITPAVFTMDPHFSYGQIWVKIDQDEIPQTLTALESTFQKLVPYHPYAYQFMDEINAQQYKTEKKWEEIIRIASMLFIFISCMGLLGLVILSIEQRTKEIGIRKVLGAGVWRITVLLSKEFILLISLAFLLAAPLGYYALEQWLQDFAYQIKLDWWMFGLAGTSVIGIALLTMSFQTIRAAVANPVKSLQH